MLRLVLILTALFFSFFDPLQASSLLLLSDAGQANASEPRIVNFDAAAKGIEDKALSVKMAEHETEAKEGLLKQASLYQNPDFIYYLQTSQYGWDKRQEIYSLSQLIRTAGKREKSIGVATNQYYASLYNYETKKLERLYQISKSFVQLVAAQELFELAVEQQQIAEEFLMVVQSKLEAGKVSLVEKNKAILSKSLSELNVRQKHAAFQTAKKNLATVSSMSTTDFDLAEYPIYKITAPLQFEEYLSKLCSQPEIVQAYYKTEAAFQNLRLERVAPIPDVTVTLGYTYSAGDHAMVAGLSLPLPLWNQNQGNIKSARYEMLKAGDEANQLWKTLETKLSNAYTELTRSYREAEDLQKLLSTATQTYEMALEGYREGKFEYYEVLEAKRSHEEIREKYVQALVDYHTKRAQIDFLTTQTD